MQKLTLRQLHIYQPSPTHDKDGTAIEQLQNDDFTIDNFLHFPILTEIDGSIWNHGSLYLLSKLKGYQKPSPKTLDSIAIDLKDFKEFCNREQIDYLSAPRKVLRPTYLYREYLQKLLNGGKVSANTVKRRISAVVGFYKYLIDIEGIEFKFPLWEAGVTSITYMDRHGFQQAKQVETKDIARVPSASNPDLFDDAIMDGGRLHPLSQEEQIAILKGLKAIGNTEMILGFLIALTTGARIQTVYTLRLKHFERVPTDRETEIRIKVGYGTSCDTKYSKQHTLIFPAWLYNKIRIYIKSERAQNRRLLAKHIFDTDQLQYVFLNNRGSPFYAAVDDPYRGQYRDAPNGTAIRQFIVSTLREQLQKSDHKIAFSFHDLRASFGMNLLNKGMALVKNKEVELTLLLISIKERMGHSSLTTTEKYLNFRDRHKLKELAQDDFESYMRGLLDE
ncbi:MAG: site-specific integrase [Sulfurimonas sp.]|jgi:integrase